MTMVIMVEVVVRVMQLLMHRIQSQTSEVDGRSQNKLLSIDLSNSLL